MPEQPILEVRGLTREFVRRGKPFPAVDDVNLTLDPGEFMAIVGRFRKRQKHFAQSRHGIAETYIRFDSAGR